MNLLTFLILNPPTPQTRLTAAEEKAKRKTRTPAPKLCRPVMRGKGPMTVVEVNKCFPNKTKCAVGNCLRDTLLPLGYVKQTYVMQGKQKILYYEWVEKEK